MAEADSVAVEAEPDPQLGGAETPAPEVKNTKGAKIRKPKKGVAKEDSGPALKAVETEPEPEPELTEEQKADRARRAGKALYPDGTRLFEYEPKAGGAFIYIPLEFDRPDKVWLWELNIQPFLSQTWAWLDRARVPRAIQRQCVSLPDDEYMDMFTAWFAAMGGGATPGE